MIHAAMSRIMLGRITAKSAFPHSQSGSIIGGSLLQG